MALTTLRLLAVPVAVPLRIGGALRGRVSRFFHRFAAWAAAAQLGTDYETEVGRKTGGRI